MPFTLLVYMDNQTLCHQGIISLENLPLGRIYSHSDYHVSGYSDRFEKLVFPINRINIFISMIIIVRLLFGRKNVSGCRSKIFNRIPLLPFLDVPKRNTPDVMIDCRFLMVIKTARSYVSSAEKIPINDLIIHL